MRGVFNCFRRLAALLVLLTILPVQSALAKEQVRDDNLLDRFERAKRFIVVIFSRIGWPPG